MSNLKKEEEETARVYADFVASFEQDDTSKPGVWVKGESINQDSAYRANSNQTSDAHQLYERQPVNITGKPLQYKQFPTGMEKTKKRTVSTVTGVGNDSVQDRNISNRQRLRREGI